MEVHHHSHTSRRKWTHYFWEFLMLFLAVFCGFLAEYQLEHKIEKDREKQFIRSMLEDLKRDTSSCNATKRLRLQRENSCDSLIDLLKSPDKIKNTNDIYYHGLHITLNNRFWYNNRTIHQLLNSGAMRLIRSQQASDSIVSYDKLVQHTRNYEEFAIVMLDNYKSFAGKVFNAAVLKSMAGEFEISRIAHHPPLLTDDTATINQLCTLALFYRMQNHNIILRMEILKSQAVRLMSFLKNEYHIE